MSSELCLARCKHGGVCTLSRGHKSEQHDSGFCRFTDAGRLTDAEGDAKFRREHPLDAMILAPWIDAESQAQDG